MNFEKTFSDFCHWQEPFAEKAINQSTDLIIYRVIKNDVLRQRQIILSKLTIDGVSFQNYKEADLANLIKGNI